ncbi:MAG: hypothetical protein IJJ91_09350 [Synergistaceae bacterium]|nr:hypothetical protein [Synergistaceae bacterium]MBQ6418864.1 hypothetical protein [Synergistaceae bacterium]MBR0184657.1 hypothetical protein [Synergistaceae bacterium]
MKFNLDERFRRPVINIRKGKEIYSALIDTGAEIPVFTLGREKIAAFSGKLCRGNVSFSGFGGICNGDLYRIDVELGILRYISLPIICIHNSEMPFAFIFSATMFTGFSYIIDDAVRTFTIDTHTDTKELRLRIRDNVGGFKILAGIHNRKAPPIH